MCADNGLGLRDRASNQSDYHSPLGTENKGWCLKNSIALPGDFLWQGPGYLEEANVGLREVRGADVGTMQGKLNRVNSAGFSHPQDPQGLPLHCEPTLL